MSKLADDAQYGAAVRVGDRMGGEAALRALAGGQPQRRAAVSEALVNLDPRALVRAGFERYRRGPLRPPEDQVTELLDGDGRRLAQAALRYIDRAPHMAISSLRRTVSVDTEDGMGQDTASDIGQVGSRQTAPHAAARDGRPAAGVSATLFRVAWCLAALAVVGGIYVAAQRSWGSRSGRAARPR